MPLDQSKRLCKSSESPLPSGKILFFHIILVILKNVYSKYDSAENMSKIVCKCRIYLEFHTPAIWGFCKSGSHFQRLTSDVRYPFFLTVLVRISFLVFLFLPAPLLDDKVCCSLPHHYNRSISVPTHYLNKSTNYQTVTSRSVVDVVV